MTAALILWAKVHKFPETFSEEVISFIEDALVKDPANRPSAEDLLNHPWLEAAGMGGQAGKRARSVR